MAETLWSAVTGCSFARLFVAERQIIPAGSNVRVAASGRYFCREQLLNWHDRVLMCAGFCWDNLSMRQLQLFTSAQLAKMRDRTASRSYSPVGDEFRREQAIRRAFGKQRRHAERRYRVMAGSRGGTPPAIPDSPPGRAASTSRSQNLQVRTSAKVTTRSPGEGAQAGRRRPQPPGTDQGASPSNPSVHGGEAGPQ